MVQGLRLNYRTDALSELHCAGIILRLGGLYPFALKAAGPYLHILLHLPAI